MTVGELKAQFSDVLEKVKQGETVQILYGRNKLLTTQPQKPAYLALQNLQKGTIRIPM